eukprot:262249_1
MFGHLKRKKYRLLYIVIRQIMVMLDSNGNDGDYDDDGDCDLNDIAGKLEDNKYAYMSAQSTADKLGARFLMKGDDYKKHGKHKGYDLKIYSHKKRFCTMIDVIDIFEAPPDDSNTLPDKSVLDWYFNQVKNVLNHQT